MAGELPYFAVEVPNPGAAKAVLERFCKIAGTELDFDPLDCQARALNPQTERFSAVSAFAHEKRPS